MRTPRCSMELDEILVDLMFKIPNFRNTLGSKLISLNEESDRIVDEIFLILDQET